MAKDSEKIFLKMKYDEETDTLRIIDSMRGKPKYDATDVEYIYASVDDVLKIKSTLLVLETANVPPIIKTILKSSLGH